MVILCRVIAILPQDWPESEPLPRILEAIPGQKERRN